MPTLTGVKITLTELNDACLRTDTATKKWQIEAPAVSKEVQLATYMVARVLGFLAPRVQFVVVSVLRLSLDIDPLN